MILEVYNAKTFDRICCCPDVEEFNIYKVDNNWILGIEYFDEAIEQDVTDTMILCKAPTDEAFDEIFVLKTSGDITEFIGSERTKKRLNQIYGNAVLMKALSRLNLKEPKPDKISTESEAEKKCLQLLNAFIKDLYNEIEASDEIRLSDDFYYRTLIAGYASGIADSYDIAIPETIKLDKSIKKHTADIEELLDRKLKEKRYTEAVDNLREKFVGSPQCYEEFEKIINVKASPAEIIELDNIRYHSLDCTGEEFRDLFESLVKKYS